MLAVWTSSKGAKARGAPAGTCPFTLGSAPVLVTLPTFEAETSNRRPAAFTPDCAIVEMLLIRGSSGRWSGHHLMRSSFNVSGRISAVGTTGRSPFGWAGMQICSLISSCAGTEAARTTAQPTVRKIRHWYQDRKLPCKERPQDQHHNTARWF